MSIAVRRERPNPVAETVGFEPTEGFNTLTVLAGPRTRPDYATSPSTCCTATQDTGPKSPAKPLGGASILKAESAGFEPAEAGYASTVFKTVTFGRSVNSP